MSLEAMDRLHRIEAEVRGTGRVRVAELARDLDVSQMTIRRDLEMLADQGVVHRVRGGAVAIGPLPFAHRFGRNARAKDRVAAKVIGMVGEGGAIGIDASSTLQRLAVRLEAIRDLTMVTNSPDTFATLQDRPGITALLTGGQLALADAAEQVIVALDSSKLGRRAPAVTLRPETGRHAGDRPRPQRPQAGPIPRPLEDPVTARLHQPTGRPCAGVAACVGRSKSLHVPLRAQREGPWPTSTRYSAR